MDLIQEVCEDMFLIKQEVELANYATQLLESDEEAQWGFFFLGRFEKAYQAAKVRYGRDTSNMNRIARLAFFAVHAGDTVSALGYQEKLMQMPIEGYDNGRKKYYLAQIKCSLGENETALDLLKQSFEDGRRHPRMLNLKLYKLPDYPPYQEFVRPKG